MSTTLWIILCGAVVTYLTRVGGHLVLSRFERIHPRVEAGAQRGAGGGADDAGGAGRHLGRAGRTDRAGGRRRWSRCAAA